MGVVNGEVEFKEFGNLLREPENSHLIEVNQREPERASKSAELQVVQPEKAETVSALPPIPKTPEGQINELNGPPENGKVLPGGTAHRSSSGEDSEM